MVSSEERTSLLCRIFGHRYGIHGIMGGYEWCSRCGRRRNLPAIDPKEGIPRVWQMKEHDPEWADQHCATSPIPVAYIAFRNRNPDWSPPLTEWVDEQFVSRQKSA